MSGQNFTDSGRGVVHYAKPHRPKLYRYRVANPGFRAMWNRYENQFSRATIGLAVVIGRYAYCVKWADSGIRFT